MLAQAAVSLSVPLVTLDAAGSPASQVSAPSLAHPDLALAHAEGKFNDPDDIRRFAQQVDVLTVEIEHVNTKVLQEIKDDPTTGRSGKGVQVYPAPEVIATIQDKYRQKVFLASHGVPLTEFLPIQAIDGSLEAGVSKAAEKLGYPLMLKSRLLAYDGRGNYLLKTASDVSSAIKALVPSTSSTPASERLYAERFAPFSCEIACMVVRSATSSSGPAQVRVYPPVETIHQNNICHLVYAPLRKGGPEASKRAKAVAKQAIEAFGEGAVGVFGVEMFLMPDGQVLLNEIAPRPHNSYHHTLSSTPVSQFVAHLLSILSLPLPPPSAFNLSVPAAAMLNLLGAQDGAEGEKEAKLFLRRAVTEVPGSQVEWYGKFGCRKGRKVGHVNVVGRSDAEVQDRIDRLLAILPSSEPSKPSNPLSSLVSPSSSSVPRPLQPGFNHSRPLVSVIMGSDSDLPVMAPAGSILSHPLFQIPYELSIVSAHRTPGLMYDFAASARSRGVRVIIAGAGGAAHLPGMVAALTTLPVIGVPVKGSSLDGVDSLHSMVQMPKGVPVATVAINNSTNAALLAIRILAAGEESVGGVGKDEEAEEQANWAERLDEYTSRMEQEVQGKRGKMEQVGWEDYLKGMPGKK